MDRSSEKSAYMPKIGTHCTIRGEVGEWRVVNFVFEGIVEKCVLQSLNTGQIVRKFNFEVTELSHSTYDHVNQLLEELSSDEMLELLGEAFVEPEREGPKRFKAHNDEEVAKLRAQNQEVATSKQTKWAIKLLQDWMNEAGYGTVIFEQLPLSEMDQLLQQFYTAVRTKDGKEYSKSALVGLRAAINRYLTNPPVSLNINIMKDRDFMRSNQVLSGLIKKLKREGKDISQHKEPICDEDLNKLYESGVFSIKSPKTLQNKVMFDIISQFGRRGQEGLRSLLKNSFISKSDAKGRKYISMTFNESDKTHHGLDSREAIKEPRMYENEGEFCPVKSFEFYLSKLNPSCEILFQRPLDYVSVDSPTWYANRAVGVNTISTFMARMSAQACLSKKYTNHCIRARVTSTLHQQGFSSRAIMSVTGHRNVASLASHIKPSEDERERLSKALCPSSTVSAPPDLIPPTDVRLGLPDSPACLDLNLPPLNNGKTVDIHMFTGNINNSTIHVNIYQKQ